MGSCKVCGRGLVSKRQQSQNHCGATVALHATRKRTKPTKREKRLAIRRDTYRRLELNMLSGFVRPGSLKK